MKIPEAVFIAFLCFTPSFAQDDEAVDDTTVANPARESHFEITAVTVSMAVAGFVSETMLAEGNTAAGTSPEDVTTTEISDSTSIEMSAADGTTLESIVTATIISSSPEVEAETTLESLDLTTMTFTKDVTSVELYATTEADVITMTSENVPTMPVKDITSVELYFTVGSVEADVILSGSLTSTTATDSASVGISSTEADYAVFIADEPTTSVTESESTGTTEVSDSTSKEETTMTVPMPPSIIRGPLESVIYRSGENVTLNCTAKGVPAVTYEWKKNGIILNETQQNIDKGVDGSGTITIRNASAPDEGSYQCVARNEYGTAISRTAHLQWAFIDSAKRNGSTVLNKIAQEGMSFHISCDPHKSFPTPTYGWEMVKDTEDNNSTPLQPSKRIQINENGDLHFAYALPEDDLDGRIYRCTINNTFLDVELKGGYTQLTVMRSPHISDVAPTLAFSSAKTARGIVTFRCFFYGYPEPTIIWSTPNDSLSVGRYTLDAFNTSLTIDNIMDSDEGNYTCTASNTKGNSLPQRRWLSVGTAPVFSTKDDGPYDANVTEGESFTVRCNATAKPAANLVWFQDGKELDPDKPPNRYEFSNNNRSLTIREVCKTDQTIIQCNASNIFGYAFAQGYLNVYRKFCERGREYPFLWSRAPVGTESFLPCPANRSGLCSRKCSLNGTKVPFWEKINCNLCLDKEFGNLQEKVRDLNVTALKDQIVVADIVSQLSILTNRSEGLSPGNLNASVMMLNRLADLRRGSTESPNEKEISSFIQATSNVLRPINDNEWKELKAVNESFASIILFSVDVYGRSLSMLNISNICNTETEDNLVLEAWSLENIHRDHQQDFPNCSVWDNNSGNRISISMETLKGSRPISSGIYPQPTHMWASYYRTIHDFLPGNIEFGKISSKVLSLSIDGLKPGETLKGSVTITLQHTCKQVQEECRSSQRTCAFWNFTRDTWDSTGCRLKSTNSSHTICLCDHLTNFAVLMNPKTSMNTAALDAKVLSTISVIGCSISVVALILTIIVYALTWKQSKSTQATVLMNLCVALIIPYVIFLAGADEVSSKIGCKVVAVLLHYFFLVAFFTMLAEGVELLLYIIFVFHVRRTRETVMLILSAWAIPLIIVSVSLGITKLEGYGNHGNDDNAILEDNRSNNYSFMSSGNDGNGTIGVNRHNIGDKGRICWLSAENYLIWAFVAPVLCVITINFVILIVVLIWMSRRRSFIANNAQKRNEIQATLWNLSVTCPVLGLGWLFGVLNLISDHLVFQYLFVIINSPQGLLIFIFHVLLHNKKVKETISYVYSEYICGCRKTVVYDVSNKMSSTQELTKKADKPGFIHMAVHDNEGLEIHDNVLSTGTQTTSIDDSGTLETSH